VKYCAALPNCKHRTAKLYSQNLSINGLFSTKQQKEDKETGTRSGSTLFSPLALQIIHQFAFKTCGFPQNSILIENNMKSTCIC
jgi:hypothetical protein